jgi:Skp family chaperone for outer membrane proteins
MGLCAAPTVFGQAPQAGPKNAPVSVALVDVGYILKQHPNMNANMEAIQAEMKQAQDDIEGRRKGLLSETEMVGKTYDQNSPEFKQKQEALISQESKLRVDFMSKEKEFAEKQAGVIYNSYQSINQAIKIVADHYKYDLVLRYSKEQNEMDPKKPQTVNFGIQRDVLYLNPQIDVTELVLDVLKRSVPAAPSTALTAPVTPTQGGVRQATPPNSQPARR